MTVIIETRQLTKRYGARVGVDGVDLTVGEGDIFGFLGPNGAGKTTLIRLLLGFLAPTAGTAHLFGLNCWRRSYRIKRDTGYLPGDVRLYHWLTARKAVRFAGGTRGLDLMDRGLALAERLRLDPDLSVRKMSRGMRQKLGLILALVHEPKLLVLDEPTSGLDPIIQRELAQLVRERAASGATVFFSSHTLNEVEALCDRVAIVRDGRIVADESLESLRRRARRVVMLRFESADDAERIEAPMELSVVARNGAEWRCELEGEAGAIRRWMAAQPVRDVTISPPDLETIFHAYYRREEGEV